MRRNCVHFVMFHLLLSSFAAIAQAGLILTPAGLLPGDSFRIIFVTSSRRDATSDRISDYDSFVTAAAASGSHTSLNYNGTPVTWQAIVSTSNRNANDNNRLPTSITSGFFGVDGTKIASGGADLWDGSLMTPIYLDENLVTRNVAVWTGTDAGGGNRAGNRLSRLNPAIGFSNRTDSSWIKTGSTDRNRRQNFYGVSSELTVPVSVPEPGALLYFGVLSLGSLFWLSPRRIQ